MRAEIIAIGTELLLGQTMDTHSATLSRVLPEYGIGLYFRQTVGDNLGRVTEAIRLALSRADLVVCIGGLGPTEDDLTREAIAAALDDVLVHDEVIEERLRKMFALRNIPWTDRQANQAKRPSCATPIDNPNGSAPGLDCRKDSKIVLALPGPRGEFVPMVENQIRPRFASMQTGSVIQSRILKICGMGESMVEESIRDLIQGANPSVGVYAHTGEVHLRLTAKAVTSESAVALLEPLDSAIRSRLGLKVFGVDGDSLESSVLAQLRGNGQTLAVAESCTGGWLGQRLTSVPGSSDVFVGGVISYTNAIKVSMLGVPESVLDAHGAVSHETVVSMATGARERLGADWALSISGVAGPGGGTNEKPVGLVFVGLSGPNITTSEEYKFRGVRDFIRERSVQAALTLLYQQLIQS